MADWKMCKNDYLALGYAVGYGIGGAESFGCKEIKSIFGYFENAYKMYKK
jgi:hypothetical protein